MRGEAAQPDKLGDHDVIEGAKQGSEKGVAILAYGLGRQQGSFFEQFPVHPAIVSRHALQVFDHSTSPEVYQRQAPYSRNTAVSSIARCVVSAAHNLSSSVAHKLSGLKITREVIRDETNDSVTGGQEDEI